MTVVDKGSAHRVRTQNLVLLDSRNIMDDLNASEGLIHSNPVNGAIHIPQEPWMFNADGIHGGRHPIPGQNVTDALYHSFKTADNSLLLFADDNSFFHTRLYYLFKLYGHETFLWNDSPGHLEEAMADRNIQRFSLPELPNEEPAGAVKKNIFIPMQKVQSAIHDNHVLLIDVRARKRYLGLEEPIDSKMGHIPGSINIPLNAIFKNGRIDFSALSHMKNELSKFSEIIVYCGSGMSATPMFLVLEGMNLPVTLYGGSFSEWITNTGNKVETGDSLLNGRMSRIHG